MTRASPGTIPLAADTASCTTSSGPGSAAANVRWATAGLCLAAILAFTPVRLWLESSMWRHMLVQFPLWMLARFFLAGALGARARERIAPWNAYGISGLVATAVVLAVLMVPRVLDLALVRPGIEIAKCTALVVAGAALRVSWRPAGLVVQGFFLGNMLPMMAVVGQMYIDSPVRVCDAYLLDDQARLGQWLVGVAAAVAVLWLGRVAWSLVRHEQSLEEVG